MTDLTLEQRQQIWRGLMRYLSRNQTVIPVTKPELQAAINALDTWVDANAAAINTALPEPFKSAADNDLKALLLVVVVAARHNVGILRTILGEVD